MKALVGGAVSLVIVAVFGSAVFTSPTVSSSQIDRADAIADIVADVPVPRHAQPEAAAGVVDLFGNEVDDAVATYSLDPAGGLYEVHSPQTEVPRLGSPKS